MAERSGGNPLFAEEMVNRILKDLSERGFMVFNGQTVTPIGEGKFNDDGKRIKLKRG